MAESVTISWIIPTSLRKKILGLFGRPVWHPNQSLASVWIRGYQMAPYLKKCGYRVRVNRTTPTPDVAIFLRRYDREAVTLATKLKDKGTKIVVDVVANYFREREHADGYPDDSDVGAAPAERVETFRELISLADQVWCVSPFLRDSASADHENVHFIPESVDPDHFDPNRYSSSPKNDDEYVLGWSGYSKKARHLLKLQPIVNSEDVKLLIISDKDPELDLEYEFRNWKYETFPKDIADTDLCVAPRKITDEYTKGHSFFKIGVFMAMGKPAIASPVPSYELLIGDGRGGALCDALEEWNEYITRYMNDPDLRREWRSQAKKSMEPYSTSAVAKTVSARITDLIESK